VIYRRWSPFLASEATPKSSQSERSAPNFMFTIHFIWCRAPIPDPAHDKSNLSEIQEGEVLVSPWSDSPEGGQLGTNGIAAAWVVAYPLSIPAFHDEQRRRAPNSLW